MNEIKEFINKVKKIICRKKSCFGSFENTLNTGPVAGHNILNNARNNGGCECRFSTTVEPVYNGHPRDFEKY